MRVDLSRMTAAAIEAALDDGKQRRPRLSGMRAVAAGAALAVAARAAVKHAPGLPRLPVLSSVPDLVRDRLADHGWLPDDEDEHYEDEGYDDDEPSAEGDVDEDVDEDEDVDDDEDIDDDEGDDDEDDDVDGPEAEADEDDDVDEEEEDLEDDEPEARADEDEDEEDDVEEQPDADADEADEVEEPDEARNGRRTTAKARRSAPRLEVPGNGADDGADVPGVLELLSARRSRPAVMSRRRRASRVDPASRPPEPPERESDTRAGSRE